MAEVIKHGKKKTSFQIKDEFRKGRGTVLLGSVLDVLLGDKFDFDKAEWCQWLFTGGKEPTDFFKDLKQQNASPVCGLVWSAQFVAYRCRDCAISPCMSLCADCFVAGNHEGHDFNMFRSQAGGACDCGDAAVMKKEGFCSRHGLKKAIKQGNMPDDHAEIAQCIISRLFLKIYDDFQSAASGVLGLPSNMPPSVEEIVKLLQKICEADAIRNITAKVVLQNIPRAQSASSQRKPDAPHSGASRLKPTNSTASGHTLVHSIPRSPPPFEFMSVEENFAILDHHDLNPLRDMNFENFPISYLEFLMQTLVKYEFPGSIATFMLLLLPEQTYKEAFTRSFCRNYMAIGKTLPQSRHPELLSNHLVHVSVQLFSSEALATVMVREEKLLDTLIAVLVEIVGGCLQSYEYISEGKASSVLVANCDHRILINHCYWPVASDLLNVLSHKKVVKMFLQNEALLHQWMYLVTLITGMNVNNRRIASHIQFEPRTYITSFSVEFESVAAVVFELMRGCNKLKDEDYHYVLNLIKATENALREWYTFVPAKPSKSTVTFHLSLHRYLALFISQAIVRFGIDETKALPPLEFLAMCMEYPLRTLIAVSEIKAGYWVYSGFQMRGQALSYVQCHFCNSMVDVDLFFVQIAASKLDPDYFLTMLIRRFSLEPWFQFGQPVAKEPPRQDIDKENSMVESFLSFILILLSQRVFSGLSDENQCKKDLAALLCVSNKTHSQLSDQIPIRPGETNETSKNLENALKKMADFKAPDLEDDVMQQGTYSPKDSVWDNDFDYLHVLQRFFMPSEYQKATERYTENMRQRGATINSHCWPPFKDLAEIHPSFKGLFRILQCKTLQKIIFFILYKAVQNVNAVTEMMLVNTIYLLNLSLRSPRIDEEGIIPPSETSKDKRLKIARKCVDYLEQFADNSEGLYGTGEREFRELNAVIYNRLSEDEEYSLGDDPSNIQDVVTILQHVTFSKHKFSFFEPMLAYMDSVVEEGSNKDKTMSRHLHHLQYLLSVISEERCIFLKKLLLHWRSCCGKDGVKVTEYSFCKQRQDRPGFSLMVTYFMENFEWLFRIQERKADQPATVFDICYESSSVIENASIPICRLYTSGDNTASPDVIEKKQSILSLLVALLTKLKETSKSVTSKRKKPVPEDEIRAGDGTYHITKLLQDLRELNSKNETLIDELAPKIGRRDGHKKRPGDDSSFERQDRRKKAMERQRKILEEFMSKQEMFKEQNVSVDMDVADEPNDGVVASQRQFDCVICGQTSTSTIDRPFGVAVLMQPTKVLGQRRKGSDFDVPPRQEQINFSSCGMATKQRKEALLKTFEKVAAGRAFEAGLDCGVHIQTCGHYLHIDCHQSYFKSLQEEHIRSFTYEQHPFDIQKGYFTCPLCRQPCNGVLPLLPDSVRKRDSKKAFARDMDDTAEISLLLKKYSEAGSLSPLTARALEFTVLTASTGTFVSLLSNCLKADGNPATALYSDRTIKEKLLILVSTLRTCLELDGIETAVGIRQRDAKRSFLESLTEMLQFHAQCLDSPMIHVWRELINEKSSQEISVEYDRNRSKIPLLLHDIPSLFIQFVLTWPMWISKDHFQHLVRMLFNVHVIQALIKISLETEGDEFQTWDRNSQDKNKHMAYDLLGLVTASLSNVKAKFSKNLENEDEAMTGISQSLLSPQAIELQVQEYVLPFLRLAASLSHVLFETPLNQYQTHEEWHSLVTLLGLIKNEETRQQDVLPTQCLNWPHSNYHEGIQSWCQDLERVLLQTNISNQNILPVNHNWPNPKLVGLPHSYDSLFQFYRKKVCSNCKKVPDDPAICLVCGAFLCFRSNCCSDENRIYECVKHSVDCGCGTGVFLVVSTSAILVIRAERGCIWGSVYLDSFGEEDKDLRRGKPLFLSKQRYEHLYHQWLTHGFDRGCKRWGLHNDKL